MSSTKSVSQKDRATLRSVVRQQYKVLRSHVAARESHLVTELDEEFDERYRGNVENIRAVKEESRKLASELNAQIRAKVEELRKEYPDIEIEARHYHRVDDNIITADDPRRRERYAAARAKIPALVRRAYAELNEQEADLLLGLAKDSLAHGEASDFIESLPDRSSVLPARITLEAIEAR